jgi:hypothetical protein
VKIRQEFVSSDAQRLTPDQERANLPGGTYIRINRRGPQADGFTGCVLVAIANLFQLADQIGRN